MPCIDISAELKHRLESLAENSSTPIEDVIAHLLHAQEQLVDMTEMRKKDEQLLYQGHLLDTISDAIISTDLNFHIKSINRAAIQLYGWSLEEAIGQHAAGLTQAQYINATREQVVAAIQQGGHWEGDMHQVNKHGQLLITHVRASTVFDRTGTPAGVVAIIRDITRIKQMESQHQEQLLFTQKLLETATALNIMGPMEEILEEICQCAYELIPHHRSGILLVDRETYSLEELDGDTLIDNQPHMLLFPPVDNYYLHTMAATGRPLLIPHTEADSHWKKKPGGENLKSYLGAPLFNGKELIGFIHLGSFYPHYFQQKHADQLIHFLPHAVLAIQNTRLRQHAEKAVALEERHQIASELHDSVNQNLFSARVFAETLPLLDKRNFDAIQKAMETVNTLIVSALAEMRTLLLELRPESLAETDISTLVHYLVKSFKSRTGIDIEMNLQIDFRPSSRVQQAIYRITQGAFSNIIRHAGASHVTFSLVMKPERIELQIQDNGRGFDITKVPPERLGLQFMAEHAKSMEASLNIISKPGHGTQLALIWAKKDKN